MKSKPQVQVSRGKLLREVARKTHRDYGYCAEIVDTFVEAIKKHIIAGDCVSIQEFGKFYVYIKGERLQRNPATDEVELYPATRVVNCSFSDKLKDAVKGAAE